MIQRVKRKDLHLTKYDACIANAKQSRIYAFSWYLDVVAENWDVLVLDDYQAVMPLPWKKKYGIKYVYPPFWVLELGIFSINDSINLDDFLETVFKHFNFAELRLNSGNNSVKTTKNLLSRKHQYLSLQDAYDVINVNYKKDRKKDLRKATKINLTKKWQDSSSNLIELFKENVGQRTTNIKASDYQVLANLISICEEKRVGETLSVYTENKELVASAFFLKHQNVVTILISATDFKNRNNGANTFLIDTAIQKYKPQFEIFNFGGSSLKSVANYFISFGSKSKEYQQIKYNNLPKLLKLFKQ